MTQRRVVARPKAFDRDEALQKAMQVFWARGYDATSIDDIVRATGVGKQSLYDTFGDKRALYLAALGVYAAYRGQLVRAALEAEGSPRESLVRLVRTLGRAIGNPCEPGCMIANAAAGAGPDDEAVRACVRASMKALENAIRTLLARAEDAGEIGPGQNLRAKARGLVSTIYGLRLTARSTDDARMLADVLEDAVARIS